MKIPGEKKEVIRSITYELAGVKCDACGRVVEPPSKEDQYNWMDDKYKYYSVITGHYDWGNDSCDSIRHYDICPECITRFVSDYLTDKKGYRSAYININTMHVYFNDTVDEDEL